MLGKHLLPFVVSGPDIFFLTESTFQSFFFVPINFLPIMLTSMMQCKNHDVGIRRNDDEGDEDSITMDDDLPRMLTAEGTCMDSTISMLDFLDCNESIHNQEYFHVEKTRGINGCRSMIVEVTVGQGTEPTRRASGNLTFATMDGLRKSPRKKTPASNENIRDRFQSVNSCIGNDAPLSPPLRLMRKCISPASEC